MDTLLDIKFTSNWNKKLDCHAFTTIRLYNMYKHIPGIRVKCFLNDKEFSNGTIEAVKPFLLHELTSYMSFLDTGYNVKECSAIIRKMYPKIDFTVKRLAFILIVKDKIEKHETTPAAVTAGKLPLDQATG